MVQKTMVSAKLKNELIAKLEAYAKKNNWTRHKAIVFVLENAMKDVAIPAVEA
jgi:hypothetical protein